MGRYSGYATPMKTPQEATREAIVDLLGEADRKVRLWTPPLNPHQAELERLQAIVDGWYVKHPADKADLVQGKYYQLEVKPRQYQRDVSPAIQAIAFERMRELMVIGPKGKPVPFDVFSVFSTTLAAMTKHLGEVWLDMVAPKKRTGRRDMKLVAKQAPAGCASKKAA